MENAGILAVCAALALAHSITACGDSSIGGSAADGGSDATTLDGSTDALGDSAADTPALVDATAFDSSTGIDSSLGDAGLPDSGPADTGPPDSGPPPPPFDGGGVWQATATGAPAWLPVSPHLFAAPLGNSVCYGAGRAVNDTLASPNHRWFDAQVAVGPGQAHAGPYDQEYGPFISAHGYVEKTTFSLGEFTPPTGIYFTFTVVPSANAPTGLSPDGTNGSILPNALFPLTSTGALYRNGVVWDPNNGGAYPAQTVFVPGIAGASHVPFFFNDNMSWAPQPTPPVEGNYEWRVTIRDANANGWDIQIPYVVQATTPLGDAGADAGCGDTKNDPNNCGACGRSCQGGTCAFGTCQPLALAVGGGGSSITALAIDATNAYFCESSTNMGLLNKVPLAGGPITNLRSDLAFTCNSFGVDANDFYWFSADGLSMMKAPIGGGAAVQVGPASNGWTIVVDATRVYWAESSVQSLPIAGGSGTRLDTTAGIDGIAVDGTNVYWVADGTTLQKTPKGGGVAPTTMYSGFVAASSLAVDGTNLYVIDRTTTASFTVFKVPLAGGAPIPLATMTTYPSGGPVVDGQNVYFMASRNEGTMLCGDVLSVPIAGGSLRTLATEQPNSSSYGFAVDATNVYWTYMGNPNNGYRDGAVMKVAK